MRFPEFEDVCGKEELKNIRSLKDEGNRKTNFFFHETRLVLKKIVIEMLLIKAKYFFLIRIT